MMRRGYRRKDFLTKMFREAMIPYEHPGEAWGEDERDFLPIFMRLVEHDRFVLDLAGGYGRVTPYLIVNDNSVILADLSIHSLRVAKKNLKGSSVGFVRIDMLHLPFAHNVFDGVWFTQGFEYVPPDERESFLRALREVLRDNGVVFVNVAKIPNECSLFSYFRNYVYWKLIKRQPIVWGEYVYRLNLEDYKGWHYHSAVFTRRIEQTIRKIGFRILKFEEYHKNEYPLTYLLQTSGKTS